MRYNHWKGEPFQEYDVVFYAVAIGYVKENDINKYLEVKRDLAVEVTENAKEVV